MPNNCENRLTVRGHKLYLQTIWNIISDRKSEEDPVVALTRLMPMPEQLNTTTFPPQEMDTDTLNKVYNETGSTNWYNWALDHWGTKWGDYDHSEDEFDGDEIVISYLTAWGPFSDQFWLAVSEQFSKCAFFVRYQEDGMQFFGGTIYHAGEIIREDSFNEADYPDAPGDEDDIDAFDKYLDAVSDTVWKKLEGIETEFDELCEELSEVFAPNLGQEERETQ